MSIPAYIRRNLSQTLVYWANPVNDGANHYTFDDPVDISGRCEWKRDLISTGAAEEVLTKAKVYLDREVEEGEYLYLGSLDDSSMDSNPDPLDVDGSMRVMAVDKVPVLGRSSSFLYCAHVR